MIALDNKIELTRLIYKLESFTEQELVQEYSRINKHFSPNNGYSEIRQQLNELKQIGAIRYSGHKYFVSVLAQIPA